MPAIVILVVCIGLVRMLCALVLGVLRELCTILDKRLRQRTGPEGLPHNMPPDVTRMKVHILTLQAEVEQLRRAVFAGLPRATFGLPSGLMPAGPPSAAPTKATLHKVASDPAVSNV